MSQSKPFLKWAGGKRQLLKVLEENLPQEVLDTKEIDLYIEPFVGGGALLFHLLSNYKIHKSIINDINPDLMITYLTIKKYPCELIEELRKIENKYLQLTEENRKDFYYNKLRKPFNELKIDFQKENKKKFLKKAYLLIALNRLCFNGLYRQNNKGQFNVPMGKYKNPKILDKENILNVSKALGNTEILCGTYNDITLNEQNGKKNLIYFDPPYKPLSKTSSFTKYSKEDFNDRDQKDLAEYFRKLDKKDFYILLSNSDTKDNFFEDLYKGFTIKKVETKRFINSDKEGRKSINELLIKNW